MECERQDCMTVQARVLQDLDPSVDHPTSRHHWTPEMYDSHRGSVEQLVRELYPNGKLVEVYRFYDDLSDAIEFIYSLTRVSIAAGSTFLKFSNVERTEQQIQEINLSMNETRGTEGEEYILYVTPNCQYISVEEVLAVIQQ